MRARASRTQDAQMRRSVPTLAAAVAAASVFVGVGPAAADTGLAPGRSQAIVVDVPDDWAANAVQVEVTVGTLTQRENDCLEPEVAAGDDCSDDVGELGGKLETTVTWAAGEGCGLAGGADRPAGVRLDLFDGEPVLLTGVTGVKCLVLDLSFPDGDTDNIAQSDSLAFPLTLVAQGLPDPVEPDPVRPDPVDPDAGDVSSPPGATGSAPSAVDGGATGPGRTQGLDGAQGVAVAPGPDAVGDAGTGEAGGVVGSPPAGPVVGQLDAQVSVDAGGVDVETQSADNSVRALVLLWSLGLLVAVALGWGWFVLARRRRRRRAEA
jgi:hypothetical protein